MQLTSRAASVIQLAACALACGVVPPATGDLSVSPSGHYVQYNGKPLLLVGDSGTQCVLQNLNIGHRQWLDDCHERGIRAVHLWSFVAPRQKQDGSVVEERYGYVYPGATPWARREGGPPAFDGLAQWDLTQFDEGDDPDKHYWPRLRDVCRRAKERSMVVGITVFFGWPKHSSRSRPDWQYHPLNVLNGGFLSDPKPDPFGTTVAQIIHSPGTEVLQETWSDHWPPEKKTQWVWERFSAKLIEDTRPFGNVFFVFMDEHSYSEGNCGDHFLQFFKGRGALWADWDRRRADVDLVFSGTVTRDDKNSLAVRGFEAEPTRPYLHLEGGPYAGDGMRTAMWTCLVGGGHYFHHADEGQGTRQTGIQGYDPNVRGGDKGMTPRDWLGHASRFFNERIANLDAMRPHNEVVVSGEGYCLAAPEAGEYVVYFKSGKAVSLRLPSRLFTARWLDPRTGRHTDAVTVRGADECVLYKPNSEDDWTLHLVAAQ